MNQAFLSANLWTLGLNLLYAVAAMLVGLVALKAVDRWFFPQIDFVAEIKRGNVAASLVYGTMLLFLSLMLSSALR